MASGWTDIWLESPFKTTIKPIKFGLTILKSPLSSPPPDSSDLGKLINLS